MRLLRLAASLLIIGMLPVYGVMTYQLRTGLLGGYSDFISAYTAGKILQRGAAEQLYDLQLQYSIQQEAAPDANIRHGALPYVRPPFEALLFWPLAYFSYRTAFVIWDAISLGILIAVTVLLRREMALFRDVPLALAVLAALSFFPVFLTFLQGQDSLLLLLIYALTYTALRRNRDLLAGAILALGTFKFPLVLPFVVVCAFARRRFLAGFALCVAGLSAISIGLVGWRGVSHYAVYLSNIDRAAPGVNVPRDMPNIRGLVALFSPVLGNLRFPAVLTVIVSITLIAWAAKRWAGLDVGQDALPLGFSANLLTTILVSYHDHVFDLCLLILPVSLLLGPLLSRWFSDVTTRRLTWGLIAAIVFSPLYLVVSLAMRASGLLAILMLLLLWVLSRPMRQPLLTAVGAEQGAANAVPSVED